MHISAISIENYRSFRLLDLKGLPAAAVIVGENAVGKSNLLRALRLVLDSTLPDSARRLSGEDFWDGAAAPMSGDTIKVVVELTDFGNDLAAKSLLGSCLVNASPLTARLTYLFRPKGQIAPPPTGPQPYEFLIFGGTDERNHIEHDIRVGIGLRVLPALRNAEEDLSNWVRSPLRPLLEGLHLPTDVLAAVSDGIEQAASELLREPRMQSLSDALGARLKAMVGEHFAVRGKFGVASGGPDRVLRVVRLFVEDVRVRAISDTSLGTANLIFLALLLEGLTPGRMRDEVVAQLLAIEEPEAHLHPHIQRVLFRSLLRSQAALLLTTHSPHITSVAPLEAIVLLRRNRADGTLGFTARAAGLVPQQIRDIERYLDVTRAEMLFARGVILVEGIAELYLVPEIARGLGHDLDAIGITVCSVHGTDFQPYRRVLGSAAFAIPHVIVTDGDPDASGIAAPNTGIRRGRALLAEGSASAGVVDAAIAANDVAATLAALAVDRVFVGSTTLETDLLPAAAGALGTAFDALVESETRRENFREAIKGAVGGDAKAAERVIARIEDIGKGRFAQQLAGHLDGVTPPTYIAQAIQQIVAIVKAHA